MINADDEVSLAYLLEPTFQIENTAGKPLTEGWIEVYIHGTRTKYYCYSDWNGSLHPFKIPLDSLGSNIILASPAHAYDVYVYNKFGSLVMSRYNVVPATGDGAVIKDVVNITSNDGTVSVESQDQTNWNLSIKDTVDRVQQNEQEISNIKVDIENVNTNITNLTDVVNNHTTEIGQIKEDVAGIESSLTNKKDKQTANTFTGSATKTIKNISQNANGELNVEFADIDLPQEVPNVEITSADKSIKVTETTDVQTNTKSFDLSVNVDDRIPDPSTSDPLMDGTASVGSSSKYAREDHVHPSDTSKESVSNKTSVVIGTSNSKYPTDKAVADFVNSSVATNTANYISNNGEPFTSVEELEVYTGTVTNNDYAFVTGTDSEGNTYYDRYKATVSGSTVTWALEYRLNNSSFTAAQWAAINSGITSDKANYWDGKQDALTFDGTYNGSNNKAATVSSITSRINNLDAAVTSTDGTNVQVKVTETDGKISAVNVTTDNTENKNNKVSTWQTTPDNTHYPSEKLVKDNIDAKANAKHVVAICDSRLNVYEVGINKWFKLAERTFAGTQNGFLTWWDVEVNDVSIIQTGTLCCSVSYSIGGKELKSYSSFFCDEWMSASFKFVTRGLSGPSITIELWASLNNYYTGLSIRERSTGNIQPFISKGNWKYYSYFNTDGSAAPTEDAATNTKVNDVKIIIRQHAIASPTNDNLVAMNENGLIKDSGVTTQDVTNLLVDHTTLESHVSNTSNPHKVTKSQVGLGNVDNTRDADKPVSTAQQNALNKKLDKTGDASNTTATFTKESGDTSSITSGKNLSTIFTAISRFFASLKALAFKDKVTDSDINGTISNSHIASASTWNGKYTKPSTGIPKGDLDSSVQESLDKADTAIQGVKVNNTTLTPDANKVVTVPLATKSADGAMSAADKTKLNGIATGAEVNVQSDWDVTDSKSDAFIKNKPYFYKNINADRKRFKICTVQKHSSVSAHAEGIEVLYRIGDGAVHGKLLHKLTYELYLERIGDVSISSNTLKFYYIQNPDSSSHVDIYADGGPYCILTVAPLMNMPKNRVDLTGFGTEVSSLPEGVTEITPVWVANSASSSGTAPVKVDAYGALSAVPMDSTPTASSTNLMTSGAIKTALDGKAASSHTHGNITDDGKIGNTAGLGIVTGTGGTVTAKDFTQASPSTGSDTTTEFISTVAQGSDGAISATKQAITPASTAAAGIVQLSSSTSSSSETMAATPKAVSDLADSLGAGKADKSNITGATKCKITYNSQGIVTAGADLSASDIPNLAASKITSGTFGTDRIADDAITAAKVKGNETLPVNISGRAGYATDADSAKSAYSAKSVDAAVDNSIKSTGTNGSMEILNGALSSSSGGGGSCSIDGDGISFTKGTGGSSLNADGISTAGTGNFVGGVEAKGRPIDGSADIVANSKITWPSSTTNLVVNRSAASTTTVDLKNLLNGVVYWLHVPRDNIIALWNSSAISTFYCYDSSLTMKRTTDTYDIRSHIRGGARDHGGFSTAIVRSNNNFYVMMDY